MAREPRLEHLHSLPATDVKVRGWRGLMRSLRDHRALLITNHNEPEAVIIPATEYAALMDAARQADARGSSELEALRRRFDERLAALEAPDAAVRLRSVMSGRTRLRRKVKAGAGR
jgi:prevent-host-death family protein